MHRRAPDRPHRRVNDPGLSGTIAGDVYTVVEKILVGEESFRKLADSGDHRLRVPWLCQCAVCQRARACCARQSTANEIGFVASLEE